MKSSVLKTSFLLQTLVLAGTCWYFFFKDKHVMIPPWTYRCLMPIITKTGDINGICVWLTMQFNMGDDKSTQ